MNNQIQKETTETHSDWQSLKRLWNLAGPLKHQIVRGIIFRFLQSFSLGLGYGVAIIVVTTLVTSQGSVTKDWFYQICFLSLLSLTGQLVFSFLSSHKTWMASFQLSSDLRIKMLRRMNQLPLGFHLSRHRGDAVTVLTTDMQTVETFLSDGLPRIAEAFGLPIAVLTYLIFQNTALFTAAAISIVLSIPVYIIASHKLAQLGIKRQDTQASAAARMIEYIQGMVVIKSFNRLAKGQEDFENALNDFRNLSNKMVKQLVFPLVIFGAITLLGIPIIFYVDSHLLLSNSINVSLFITALMLIYALYSPLLGLVAVLEQTRMADASLTRMNRVLNAETLSEPEHSEKPSDFDIKFNNVSFGYNDDQSVINNINFSARQNSVTAIVGPSGAGKSTLLNLVARFWDVTSGEISIGGVNLQQMKTKDLNKLVTFVFQNVYLFSGTIMDNLLIGRPHATQDEIIYAAKMAQAYDFIMDLPDGFDTQIGEGGATLSGGERQRLSIARAMLKDAPIILMDEATAAIDPTNERAFYQALKALTANKTVLIVAHKLSTIKNADQIIVMNDGNIVQQGSHTELVNCDGLYKNLWDKWSGAANWKFNPLKH
ncbi:ABC transporter ATP-binding protein [Vibrio salinus]|uniref:ABC transporter ATP-binding protein n=1 Tax=Vibrio salinus TaxID=2899784 RepID=UPI001E5328E6|nr:ABC transporter ATP-binding protein [Vibrio salinus]MCE0495707.1 ABC transporter ATP-binding protein/permease [Vibrio salinus]